MNKSIKENTGKEKLVDVDEAWVNAQEATRKAMQEKNEKVNDSDDSIDPRYLFTAEDLMRTYEFNGETVDLNSKYVCNIIIAKSDLICANLAEWIHKIKKGSIKLNLEELNDYVDKIDDVIDALRIINHNAFNNTMRKRCNDIIDVAKKFKKRLGFMKTIAESTMTAEETKVDSKTFINVRLTELLTNEINEVTGNIKNERVFRDGSTTDEDKNLHSDNIAMNTSYLTVLQDIMNKYCK